MTDCRITIAIVNWNHLLDLQKCLASVSSQDYKSYDIVVIDNASTDGSTDWIRLNYPWISLFQFEENRGFSAALNEGIRRSTTPFILSLNPDVILDSRCLSYMIGAIIKKPQVGIVSPKLLRYNDPRYLDSTGLFIDRRRCPYDRGQNEIDHGQYDNSRQIFGACGALALYRREMLLDIAFNGEYFDEDFFAYYEDADIAWRAQLCGWRAVFEPRAQATHVRGWGDSLRKQRIKSSIEPRLAFRNRYLMIEKNDRPLDFLFDLPFILASEILRIFYAVLFMPSVLLGIYDFFAMYGRILPKRHHLWKKASINNSNVRSWFIKAKRLS